MIKPKKAYYVVPKDETTIIYDEKKGNRIEEKHLTFKGKLSVKPTIHNMVKIIKEKRNILMLERNLK